MATVNVAVTATANDGFGGSAYEDYDDPSRKRHLLRLWLARPDFADGDAGLRKGITVEAT